MSQRDDFFATIQQAKKENNRMRRLAPYLFVEYLNWQYALQELKAAKEKEQRLRKIWQTSKKG
jgi:uncharacterized protein YutD